MNICYWNIHKNKSKQSKQFDDFLLEMLTNKSIDLFCISEFDQFEDSILLSNNYELVDEVFCDKVKCYKKSDYDFVQIRIDDRFSIIEHKALNILLVCVHSYDAINYNETKRLHCMEYIKMEIDSYIKRNGQTNVFIFGDFNCMPYDDSIIDEDVFNCVLYKDLLNTRSDAKERYYNPMLLLLSENNKIYGSFYSDNIKNRNLRWYILDQLMVNKHANNILNYNSMQLIKGINDKSLLLNNKPNSSVYSDHLPLFFEIMGD